MRYSEKKERRGSPVDVNQLARRTCSTTSRRGHPAGTIDSHDFWIAIYREIEADPVQMQQVLLNLATNAMDAMATVQARGILRFGLRRHGEDEVAIAIDDNGPASRQRF